MSDWNPVLREKIFNKYFGHCAYCGCTLERGWHLDHFVPKRRGNSYSQGVVRGKDEISNYMPACKSCNSCKSDLDIEDFRDRVSDRIKRLKDYSEYNIAKRFGLVKEVNVPVIFFFEKFI